MDITILTKEQKKALSKAVHFLEGNGEDFIITGAAGTGKSFLVAYILKEAMERGFNTHRTASTNKAAKVIDGGTIHSLLGLVPKNDYDRGVQTLKKVRTPTVISDRDVVVIDESSMIDSKLLEMILTYSVGAKLIFVGDTYQLPPVFEPISPALNEADVELIEVQRQALTSPIIPFATKFREVMDGGKFPIPTTVGKDIVVLDGKEFQSKIKEEFMSAEYENDVNHCRVVAWTNQEVSRYNRMIRQFWYPQQYQEGEILVANSALTTTIDGREKCVFKNETLLEVLSSRKETRQDVHGQVLRVTDAITKEGAAKITIFVADTREDVAPILSKYAGEAQLLTKELKTARSGTAKYFEIDEKRRSAWRLFFSIKAEFADVRPVHASTIHKAQGSTYNSVFIDVDDVGKNRKDEEIARLMYVAITRASNTVYLKGQLPRRLYK